jgi:hypothetical protein
MRRVLDLWSPAIGAPGTVIAYGHWERPVLVFPSEAGQAGDFEANGMVDSVADLLDEGRVKLYCVSSYDGASWSDRSLPLEERARCGARRCRRRARLRGARSRARLLRDDPTTRSGRVALLAPAAGPHVRVGEGPR